MSLLEKCQRLGAKVLVLLLLIVVGVETDTDVALDADEARGLNRFSYSRLFFILTIRIDVRNTMQITSTQLAKSLQSHLPTHGG